MDISTEVRLAEPRASFGYLTFVIISQVRIDTHRVEPAPKETSLALTLRICDYPGTEEDFLTGLPDEATRALVRVHMMIWPFSAVAPGVAPYTLACEPT